MKKGFILILIFIAFQLKSQTKIYGVIKDDAGYEVEFASVSFADNSQYTNSDAEGNYEISCKECTSDTLVFRALGFKPYKTIYRKNTDQKIDVALEENIVLLEEVILSKMENPAFAIMRKVIDNKSKNDIRALDFYEYESYNKIEVDMKNLSEEFMEKKILGKIGASLQELEKLIDDQGRQYFPIFISETMSDYYYKTKPEAIKEIIKATRTTGVGVTDESFLSQLVGATFAQFNFSKNSIRVLEKDFISPIADGWRIYYEYELEDSIFLNDRFSYELNIKPKNQNALAFVGKIWIDKETFALSKIDLTIPPSADINYINSINIKREWQPTLEGPFFPRRTDLVIDAENLNEKWASPLIRSTFTVNKLILNKEKDNNFYEYPLEINEDSQPFTSDYWKENRHDSLKVHEAKAFALVDTIKNLPSVKSYLDVLNIVVNGHKDFGKIAVGPYISSYAYNNIEGSRFRMGIKTNIKFSKKMFFNGYLAYGTKDQVLKHNIEARFILSRKPYIETGFQWRKELDRLGLDQLLNNNIFESISKWGTQTGAYYSNSFNGYIYKQLNKHFSGSVGFNKKLINPTFDFGYYKPNEKSVYKTMNTSNLEFKLRFAHNEGFINTNYGRKTLGSKKPEFSLLYNLGIKNVLNSDFNFHKLILSVDHLVGIGVLGEGRIQLNTGKIFGTLPYPLLNVHLGNETPIYVLSGFNLMNYFEFVSDQFIDLKYVHHFNGFFFDKIPLFKKLKWREVVNITALWGNVNNKNRQILEPKSRIFGTFGSYPYVEMGYGVENIFKVLRVELFQRLSYLNRPNVNQFGLKFGLQFAL